MCAAAAGTSFASCPTAGTTLLLAKGHLRRRITTCSGSRSRRSCTCWACGRRRHVGCTADASVAMGMCRTNASLPQLPQPWTWARKEWWPLHPYCALMYGHPLCRWSTACSWRASSARCESRWGCLRISTALRRHPPRHGPRRAGGRRRRAALCRRRRAAPLEPHERSACGCRTRCATPPSLGQTARACRRGGCQWTASRST